MSNHAAAEVFSRAVSDCRDYCRQPLPPPEIDFIRAPWDEFLLLEDDDLRDAWFEQQLQGD